MQSGLHQPHDDDQCPQPEAMACVNDIDEVQIWRCAPEFSIR